MLSNYRPRGCGLSHAAWSDAGHRHQIPPSFPLPSPSCAVAWSRDARGTTPRAKPHRPPSQTFQLPVDGTDTRKDRREAAVERLELVVLVLLASEVSSSKKMLSASVIRSDARSGRLRHRAQRTSISAVTRVHSSIQVTPGGDSPCTKHRRRNANVPLGLPRAR
jgi:hypothetical protein